MTNSKNTKRALLASVLSVVLCCAMLVGSTFAWFTDSVTSAGNIIKSGSLKISATVHDLVASGIEDVYGWLDEDNPITAFAFTEDFIGKDVEALGFSDSGVNFKDNDAFMSDSLFEPGKTYVKMIRVQNKGDLAAKIKLHVDMKDVDGLQDALWFALAVPEIQFEESLQYNRQPMSKLNEVLNTIEIALAPSGQKTGKITETADIIFAYGMDEEAGNEYQNKSLEAIMSILATQYTYEKDSFDEKYDAKATYPVLNAVDFKNGLENGGIVIIEKPFELLNENTEDGRNSVNADTTINLNSSTVTFRNMAPDEGPLTNISALYTENYDLTLNAAEGGIDSDFYGINVGDASNPEFQPTVTINGGTYKAGSVVNVESGTVYITGGVFDGRDVYGDGAQATYLLNCIDRIYNAGLAKIIVTGGTFINFNPANNSAEGAGTNFVAEGYIVETRVEGSNTYYTVVPA